MNQKIQLLDQNTINKIAAGEVIERPMAVVKELVENSIDAGANAITVEIKDGGITFIRITDNGAGIPADDIPVAFKRHSTSKIKQIEDLMTIKSLGFRGEALSSIAAVSQVELITKTSDSLTGIRYIIEGSSQKSIEEIGCPTGTTFIIRNLFFNTPARRKFLKTAATETSYISEMMERIALSHPEIAFKLINGGQIKLQTSGNGNLKDIIYHIYGRDITSNLIEISSEQGKIAITGFICKPTVSRGNRNYMNYFINGRYIKSQIIQKSIENAYKNYSMAHRYPFVCLMFSIDSDLMDVNVHPTKMEIRFSNQEEVYDLTFQAIEDALKEKELIPDVSLTSQKLKEKTAPVYRPAPEPFERKRLEIRKEETKEKIIEENVLTPSVDYNTVKEGNDYIQIRPEQLDLFEQKFVSKEKKTEYHIIGQVFQTYWLIEFENKMLMIDQHAAHEKILYEKLIQALKEDTLYSQMLQPPIIVTLTAREENALTENLSILSQLGFEIEPFGGNDYTVSQVPSDFLHIISKELFVDLLDMLVEEEKTSPHIILEKCASMSCKAAVKANHTLSLLEAKELIDELMQLENPYNCPHGRPTMISMTKTEIEKKFKRIV